MRERGFTLLEVLVATVIMAAAVVALLGSLSTSLQNAARLTDYDRAQMIAKRVMDDLLTRQPLAKMTEISGTWDREEVGVEGGWRAYVTPFERGPRPAPGQLGLDRIRVEVWWMAGSERRTFELEAYQAAAQTAEDLNFAPEAP